MKLAIIINPTAGGGKACQSLLRYVEQWPHPEWEVEILTTKPGKHAGLLARDLIHHPPDLLAVCGGDGSLNEVASFIPEAPFPVAVLPAGTANVLARELDLPLNPIKALRIALEKTTRRVDLGELKGESERRFLFVAGIGYDAYVASRVEPKLKQKLGKGAFVIEAIRGFRDYAFPEFEVIADTGAFRATSCLVCNAKSYGGGLVFCPKADMRDGVLDIMVIEGKPGIDLVRFMVLAWFGAPANPRWIHRFKTKTLRVEGPGEVMIQTDGELAGRLPVDIGLAPLAFPLVVP